VRLPVRQQSTKIRCPNREPCCCLTRYPAAIPLSNHTLVRLVDLLRQRHNQRRCRWRRLDAGQQALLVLAHLRNGDTYVRLGAGFRVAASTAWRYVREAIDVLAALADDVTTAAQQAARLAFAILDGTLIPIDRIADQKPYYSGETSPTWCERAGPGQALPSDDRAERRRRSGPHRRRVQVRWSRGGSLTRIREWAPS
jgi:hypothetical protein